MNYIRTILLLLAASVASAQTYYEKTTIQPSIKASADTTGTTDTAALSAALARGPMVLARGTYYVCNVIVPDGGYLAGVASQGYVAGYATTSAQTKLVAGSGCATQMLNVSAVLIGAVMKNLFIDCNSLDIMGIGNASYHLNIDTITVKNCSPSGVKGGLGSAAGFTHGPKIHHSQFYGNGYGAINLIDGKVDDSNFTSNTNCGVYLATGSAGVLFTGNYFEWNGTYGVCVFQGFGVEFNGNTFDRNTLAGLRLNGAYNITATGTIFARNGASDSATLLDSAQISITGASYDLTFTGIQTVIGDDVGWGHACLTSPPCGTVTPRYVFAFDTGGNTPTGVHTSNSVLTGFTSTMVDARSGTPTNYSYIGNDGHADQLLAALPVASGGTGTASTLTGLVRGSASAMTAAELSGDCTTSGSNAVTCTTAGTYYVSKSIAQWGVPVIVPSSGDFNAGVVTLTTALPAAADCSATVGCYMYFPSAAICATCNAGGVSAAGVYYCQNSGTSTTVFNCFNNVLASGVPVKITSPTAFTSPGDPAAYTQTTGSALTVLTVPIAGNLMGPNGDLVFDIPWGRNNTANAGTFILKYGGTQIGTQTAVSVLFEGFFHRTMRNAGTTAVQFVAPATATNATENGTSTTAETFTALDTTASQNVVVTIQLATATDSVRILGGKILADYAP